MRVSGSNRIFFIIVGGIVFLSLFFIVDLYLIQIEDSRKEVLSKLEAIANTTSLLIDGDAHAALSEKYAERDAIRTNEDDTLYASLHQTLSNVYKANGLRSPVYTVVYDSLNHAFQFIGTSSLYPYFRHTYKQFPRKLLEKYHTGGTLDEHESENGIWLSAFAPVKNKKGKTVALVQVDREFSAFIQEARSKLFKNLLIALMVFLLVGVAVWRLTKRILHKEESFKKLLLEQKEEIETQSNLIQESNQKLEDANTTIREQNETLRFLNGTLDIKVKERTTELKRANEELATYLYRSSHDILGPIASLKGLCHVARIDVKNEEAKAYLHDIEKTTERLEHVVRSLNAVYTVKTQLTSAQQDLLQKTNIFTCIQDIIDTSFHQYESTIEFIIKADKTLEIITFPALIRIVLYELLRNAVTYRKENELNPYVAIEVYQDHTTQQIIMLVNDNGSGIPQEIQKELFSMFKRGHTYSSGPGLGLYIVKSALDAMQGKISIIQKNTPGTLFRIEFGQEVKSPASVEV